jgi:hypothetical protein
MATLKMLGGVFKFLGVILGLVGIFYLYYYLFKILLKFYKNAFKLAF